MPSHSFHGARTILLTLALLGADASAAGTTEEPVTPTTADEALARVNGVTIPRRVFDEKLGQALETGRADTPALRASIRDRVIAEELYWQEANRRRSEQAPEVVQAIDTVRRQAAIQAYLHATLKVTEPDEQEVRRRYEQTLAALGPQEFKFSLIQTRDEATIREAEAALARGGDFAALVQRVPVAPAAMRGGKLDWVSFPLPVRAGRTNGVPPSVADALAKLKPSQVSAPLQVDDDWVIVRLDAARETFRPSYDQARPLIAAALKEQARNKAILLLSAELLQKASIEARTAAPQAPVPPAPTLTAKP
ncbi:MAG: peptidyl-prolyl cis-trans isomerase [Defluviicoccus sp.]|nr:peptidyl-prolyl cis-trans isomerase [Defluviicoccus sp.]